jgi:hypothetical protein
MRKNDLIKLLQGIKGNPEILLWNGHAGDFMNIKGTLTSDLVKMTKEYYLEMCRLEECFDKQDWNFQFSPEEKARLEANYAKVIEWEPNEFVTTEDVKDGRYKSKKVLYIEPKVRGKTSWDRAGSFSY